MTPQVRVVVVVSVVVVVFQQLLLLMLSWYSQQGFIQGTFVHLAESFGSVICVLVNKVTSLVYYSN